MNQGENSGEESGNGIGQDIAQPYRAGSAGMPSAAADAAILMLARAAAVHTPVRATAAPVSLMRRWRAPLALAASLVLGVGIVSRIQVEEENGAAPGAISAAPPLATPPAPAAPPSSVPSAPELSAASPVAQPAAPEAPGGLERKTARKADDAASAPAPILAREAEAMNRTTVPQPPDSSAAVPPGPAAPPASAAPTQAEAGATARAATSGSAGGAPARASAPAMMGEARRDGMARQGAEGTLQKSDKAPALAELTEQIEATLTPEQWLRRIIDARLAGRHDEADASLARFISRHPVVVVPPEARRERP